jgi:SSS family solute:Na+ symporter
MGLHVLDLGIIAFYLLLMLYLGYRGWKMSTTSSDYLLAGRRLGYAMYIGCLAAVCFRRLERAVFSSG